MASNWVEEWNEAREAEMTPDQRAFLSSARAVEWLLASQAREGSAAVGAGR